MITRNKVFSLFIAVLFVLSIFPMVGFAENTGLRLQHDETEYMQLSPEQKGTDITLRVEAENDDPVANPITYYWWSGNNIFENNTDSTYTIKGVSADTTGWYYCTVYDGDTEVYYQVYVYFDTDLVLEIYPQERMAEVGSRVEVEALATSSAGDVSYEWFTPSYESYSTDATLVIDNFQKEHFGWWICAATDGYRTMNFSVHLSPLTGLKLQHDEREYMKLGIDKEGSAVTLRVEAINDDPSDFPITYQWYRVVEDVYGSRRVELENNTDPTYTIKGISADTTGWYYCEVSDGGNTIGYGVHVFFDSGLEWKTLLQDQMTEVGSKIEIQALATSSAGDVSYEWFTPSYESYSTDATLVIDDFQEEYYGWWTCKATDGYDIIRTYFRISPVTDLTVELEIDDFTVVQGETITIKGRTYVTKIEGSEDLPFLYWGKHEPFQDDKGNWHDDGINELWGISDDFGYDDLLDVGATYTENDNKIIVDFWITISNISEIWDGRYVIVVDYGFSSFNRPFRISIEDYSQTRLVGENDYSLQGILHPAAELWVEEIQNKADQELLEQALGQNEEIILAKDVSLKIQGEAKEYLGELTLTFPVGEKYNGQRLKVLHGLGDKAEILYGEVKEGVLIFETTSLSPFAVVADKENVADDNSSNDSDNVTETLPSDTENPSSGNIPSDSGNDITNDENKKPDQSIDGIKDGLTNNEESIPKTGDGRIDIWIPVLMILVSYMVIALLLIYKKRETRV